MATKKQPLREQAKQKYLEYIRKIPELQRIRIELYTKIIFTFSALIIFIVFAINPTVGTIIQLKKQLRDSIYVRDQVDLKFAALSTLGREYDAMTAELPYVFSAVPRLPNGPYLFGELQALAKKDSVVINSLQTDSIAMTKAQLLQSKTTSSSFSMTCDGTYNNLMTFLGDISSFDRIVSFSDISLTKEDGGKVRLSLKATAYVKAQ